MAEPNWGAAADLGLFAGLIASLGRAARWARKERSGWRRWSWQVVTYETVLALFSGFVGAGLGEAMGLGEQATWATIALLSYFGPEFMEDLVLRFRDRELPTAAGRRAADDPNPEPPQE